MKQPVQSKPKEREDAEARLERIKHMLADRGQDVASLVRTWLHEQELKKQR